MLRMKSYHAQFSLPHDSVRSCSPSLLRCKLLSMWLSKLFSRHRVDSAAKAAQFPLYFYNTLGKELQEFRLPPMANKVRMYNCGPTVYGRQHIGNLSMFVFADTIRRVLEYNGFTVKQVINFTDFGHLSGDNEGDADHGEDRMTKGLKAEGLAVTMENMHMLARKYAGIFIEDIKQLNVPTDKITFPYASDFISAQIAMIQTLIEKEYAYVISDGVYFDTSHFPRYGALGGIDIKGQMEGARVATNEEKRNPTDFALWKFDTKLGWESPWGKGFPGWHIECSAMIRRTLGEQIDIHTGGIEHIPVHHNNEIAQSEATTGKQPFSRFWMHRAHIQIDGEKIAKSEGNVVYLSEIIEKGYHPLALRYLFLGAHYRSSMNFTWESLDAASTAYLKLQKIAQESPEGGVAPLKYVARMHERMNDDLDTAGTLAVLWEMTKDAELSPADIRAGLLVADELLGLGFGTLDSSITQAYRQKFGHSIALENAPQEIRTLIEEREEARTAKDWKKSDELRDTIAEKGFEVNDTPEGVQISEKG